MKTLPVLLFALLGIIWGSNFIYMKWASEYISTAQIVLLRVGAGALPVFIYALIRKQLSIGHLKYVGHFLVMALIATIIYYYGFAKGASLLFSGVAGALSGAIPIFAFVLALLLLPEEKPTVNRLLGIMIGFLGIVLIARPFDNELTQTNISGVLYMVLGSLSVGASFIYAKKFIVPLNISSAALTTYQLGLALILLWIFTDTGGMGKIADSPHVFAGAVIGLGILGTGLAYIIYYYIIDQLGAVAASSVTYIPPIVALIIGAVLVGEQITAMDYLATALIFLGVILVNKRGKKQHR